LFLHAPLPFPFYVTGFYLPLPTPSLPPSPYFLRSPQSSSLGPFHEAIAVPSVTRCRCRRRRGGHRCAGGVRQLRHLVNGNVKRLAVANGPNIFQMLLVPFLSFPSAIFVLFTPSTLFPFLTPTPSFPYPCFLHSVTGQLADKPNRRQPTRTQVNSWTSQLAHRSTRRQYNSRTSNLADKSTSGQTY